MPSFTSYTSARLGDWMQCQSAAPVRLHDVLLVRVEELGGDLVHAGRHGEGLHSELVLREYGMRACLVVNGLQRISCCGTGDMDVQALKPGKTA